MFVKPRSFGDVGLRLGAAFRASALRWGCQRGLPLVHEPWEHILLLPVPSSTRKIVSARLSKDGLTADRWGAVPPIPRNGGFTVDRRLLW